MKSKTIITVFSAILLLVACSSEKKLQPIRENLLVAQSLPRNADEAYARMKGIPARAENAITQSYSLFSHQTAMADYLLQHDYADDLEVNLKLLEQRNKALLTLHFDRVVAEKLTDEAIREFYDENTEKFGEQRVKVAVLKFRTTPNMTEEQRGERRALAERVAEDIAAGAMTFDQAYASYHNGDEPLELEISRFDGGTNMLLEMSKGEVSSVIEGEGGYAIYQLRDDPKTDIKPLNEVKDQIAYHLKQQYRLEEEDRLAGLVKK